MKSDIGFYFFILFRFKENWQNWNHIRIKKFLWNLRLRVS